MDRVPLVDEKQDVMLIYSLFLHGFGFRAHLCYGGGLEECYDGHGRIGFAGGLMDPDTGLVRFGCRDYDPGVGRFTAPDPRTDPFFQG